MFVLITFVELKHIAGFEMSSNSLEHGVELADNGSDVGTP